MLNAPRTLEYFLTISCRQRYSHSHYKCWYFYVEVLRGEFNSRSTYVPAQLTKDQLLVHYINTFTKINVKIDKCELPTFYWLPKLYKRPYESRFISNWIHCSTTILSKILHLLLQLSKIMLWSTVKLLLAIIFGPLKTLPRSSRSSNCVIFRVLTYLLSTSLLYTPHCHMILSNQKCCLWSTGISTESQNLTSVLHLGRILATGNVARIDVGLARSYVKLLHIQNACAIWWHGISTNSRDSYGH